MIRRSWQDLSALYGSVGRPAISAFVYWGCAALAFPLATEGGYAGAVSGAFVFGIAVLFLAYWLGTDALAFAVDARRSCLPGLQRLARRANLLALVLLLPALVLPAAALAGSRFGEPGSRRCWCSALRSPGSSLRSFPSRPSD